ncbi:hypothetical protein P8452_00523 [Trifolium repens]|nr:hypothetical protein P8452_00523 [Trifolium repens]
MSRTEDFIKDINDGKELWKLGVRLEDMWKTGLGRNEHLEFLILDKQGDNIQVLLPSDLCPLWEPKLQEGGTYIMQNFKVQKNEFKVKMCDHQFMLVIVGGDGGTDFIPTKLPNIPKFSFNFKPFSEIKTGKYRDDLLVDVIGAVFEIAPAKSNFGSKKFPTSFSIADADMNILTCALWDKYGTAFLEGYSQCDGKEPVIVIIKHGKIKEPQGQFDLTISNAWSGTKVIMNQELQEIKDFIQRLPGDYVSQTQAAQQTAQQTGVGLLLQNSQNTQYSSGSRYAFQAPSTHLAELLVLPDEEMVTTVGTPHHVCMSKNGWFYLSCAECSKAIINDSPPYKCKVESHVTPNPGIKYRLEAEVRYEGHRCRFLIWDREAAQLIKKTAAELRDIMQHEGNFNPREYPAALDDLCGKELAFKVKMQAKAKVANVISYRDDPEIIQHLKDQFMEQLEQPSPLCIMPPSHVESSQMNIDNQTTGTSGDITITTRSGDKTFAAEPTSAKLSSNKIKLKPVKKEKMTGHQLNI